MKKHSRAEEKGKQYDHEHFIHSGKGVMQHGGLEHHESGGSGYKHPHKESHSNDFPQYGE